MISLKYLLDHHCPLLCLILQLAVPVVAPELGWVLWVADPPRRLPLVHLPLVVVVDVLDGWVVSV